jgi:hypothetical protein
VTPEASRDAELYLAAINCRAQAGSRESLWSVAGIRWSRAARRSRSKIYS